jgi:uncharacterized membrane protein
MQSEIKGSVWRRIMKAMRKHFLAGIIVVIPVAATLAVLIWFFINVDNVLQPVIEFFFGRRIVGVGFGVAVIVIYIIGIIASNLIGRKILNSGERLLDRIPIFRQIYRGFKQVTDSLSGYQVKKAAFREVVLVEFPREGMKTIGFITNEIIDEEGNTMYAVYVPTAPIPTSGYFEFVSEEMLTRVSLTVDEAMKMIMSSGIVSPPKIDTREITDDK